MMLTMQQVADRLGISRVRVFQLIKADKIKSVRFGWAHQIDEAEVERFKKVERRPGRPR